MEVYRQPVDVNQLLDEELGSAPKKPAALDVNQLLDEELAESKPYDPRTAYEQPAHLQGRKTFSDPDVQEAVREDMEGMGRTAISSIDLAMAMLPGAGSMEAGGAGRRA